MLAKMCQIESLYYNIQIPSSTFRFFDKGVPQYILSRIHMSLNFQNINLKKKINYGLNLFISEKCLI